MIIEVNGKKVEIKINKTHACSNIGKVRSNIYRWFSRIGITEEYISFDWSRYNHEEPWAEIRWKVNEDEFYYKCDTQDSGQKCLAALQQLVHQEVIFIERGIKTFGQVMNQFRIGFGGVIPKSSRKIIGVDEKMKDLEFIKFKYKQKVKDLHPDRGGDEKKMQELNNAMKQLEGELK